MGEEHEEHSSPRYYRRPSKAIMVKRPWWTAHPHGLAYGRTDVCMSGQVSTYVRSVDERRADRAADSH